MNIQAEKLELMRMILETDNPKILASIKKIFKKQSNDFWETIPKSQKDEIFEGIKQIENGEIIDYDDFMNNHKNES
ncbi:hypothetical protein ACE01N_11175 [Saccharicrinis sp. FJH2]|uniref:hypothetical protein n=1 Tax=Saccharicrinis sp. FJH65 TaxID=3344659 RepID=UPI0035F232E1